MIFRSWKIDYGSARTAAGQPHSSGIKDGDGKIQFWVVCSLKGARDFPGGRNIREKSVKNPERELGLIPILMQDIHVEELEIRNDHVDGTVGKAASLLNEIKIIAHVLPGSIYW